jgi:methanogenesis imperfect marker protein 11
MSEIFTPDEVRERFGAVPYITPYERIVALVDPRTHTVEVHEFHARGRCTGGAAWEVFHYGRTSPLVTRARREGARNIFVCEEGRAELELVPGIAGAGLEEVEVEDGVVALTYAGLAGGGVAATLCRGMASNVISTEVHERGGGASMGRATLRVPASRKLVVGVDDTDDAERGATWSTVNEIAASMEREGVADYLLHTIAQLFPDNPFKTTNCCATSVVMGVADDIVPAVVTGFIDRLKETSFSPECGMAWTTAILARPELREFAARARDAMVSHADASEVANKVGVTLVPVTGERGCIGALAAVGLHDDPDEAVRLDRQARPR